MKAPLALLAAASLLAGAAHAQETHSHSHDEGEALGKVSFPTSCRGEVATEFTRAVALLHSFGYEESRRAFESVAARDPDCAMAYWGVAMTYYHPIWSPPDSRELAAGRAAAAKAEAAGPRTDRERGYIQAIAVFYRDSETQPHAARARAWSDASKRCPAGSPTTTRRGSSTRCRSSGPRRRATRPSRTRRGPRRSSTGFCPRNRNTRGSRTT